MLRVVTDTDQVLSRWRAEIERRLRAGLDRGGDCPPRLQAAMEYSLLAGGKRLRPLLVLMACDACGGDAEAAMPAACAIEMVHTYSLIHDDLPAMDDDDLRRGRPTSHIQFDEATAILAGDALLTLAFEVLASEITPPEVAAACCADLAAAAGMCGMVGGQMADLQESQESGVRAQESAVSGQRPAVRSQRSEVSGQEAHGSQPVGSKGRESGIRHPASSIEHPASSTGHPVASLGDLESVHKRKTARLLCSALTMGGRIAGADGQTLRSLTAYGESVGLAFQIADDLLDVGGDAETMGKGVRKDAELGKLTYPALLGVEESRRRAEQLIEHACRSIQPLGERGRHLRAIARYVIERDR